VLTPTPEAFFGPKTQKQGTNISPEGQQQNCYAGSKTEYNLLTDQEIFLLFFLSVFRKSAVLNTQFSKSK